MSRTNAWRYSVARRVRWGCNAGRLTAANSVHAREESVRSAPLRQQAGVGLVVSATLIKSCQRVRFAPPVQSAPCVTQRSGPSEVPAPMIRISRCSAVFLCCTKVFTSASSRTTRIQDQRRRCNGRTTTGGPSAAPSRRAPIENVPCRTVIVVDTSTESGYDPHSREQPRWAARPHKPGVVRFDSHPCN